VNRVVDLMFERNFCAIAAKVEEFSASIITYKNSDKITTKKKYLQEFGRGE